MKLNINIIGMLNEVEHRKGFQFLLTSTRITLPELQRALRGEDVREETGARLQAWTDDRIELSQCNGKWPCEHCEEITKTRSKTIQTLSHPV
jgi:hypothetical protein